MNRRTFLRRAGVAPAVLASAASRPPNVVLMISDDQGWTDYGFMGHPAIRTPRLDALSKESVTFTRGYSAAPLCCPSLASILTGLHPHQHGITSNDPPRAGEPAWNPERLTLRKEVIGYYAKAPCLPRLLVSKGYVSFQAGKWWGGHYSNGGFTAGMTHGDPARGGRHGDEGLKIGRETMQPVWDFVDGRAGKPFFLWFAPMMPHSPHTPPERLLAKYREKTESIHVARYWAMCEWWDEVCGQLLDGLDRRGLREETLVFYTCDNGWIQRPDSPQFAARSKQSRFDMGVRTPIMVRWPGRVTPRRDERTLVSNVDLAPTILAAAGMAMDRALQGVDLMKPFKRDTVFGAAYTHDAVDIHRPVENLRYLWAVEGDLKLMLPGKQADDGPFVELYDLGKDPHEKENLAGVRRADVERIRARIQKWWPEGARSVTAQDGRRSGDLPHNSVVRRQTLAGTT
jgi:uncharacterized sulfatase